MHIRNSSFCIVASTLPIGFLSVQADALKIKRIYVLNEAHEASYSHLKKKNPELEIVRAPSGLLSQSLCFLLMLLWVRLSSKNIIFFHECCMPVFDLLLTAIRPRGYYFPQVTMSGFEEIKPEIFPRKKLYRFLKFLRMVDSFKFYRSRAIGDNDLEYVVSIRRYPNSITSMGVGYSRDMISKCYSYGGEKTNKILFVTGKSFVADAEQVEVFSLLVAAAHAKGYVCHIKDHPNPVYRLNLSIEGAITIDPLLPAELMDRDYYLAIGVSSKALLAFNERAISLVNMLDQMSQEDRLVCIAHFEEAFPGNKINYVRSLDEFKKLL